MGTGKELPLIRTSLLFAFDAPQMSAMSRPSLAAAQTTFGRLEIAFEFEDR